MLSARVVLVLAGIAVGVLVPRTAHAARVALSGILGFLVMFGILMRYEPAIWQVAVGLALSVSAAMLVARGLPRLATFVVLVPMLAIAVLTVAPGGALRIAFGVVAVGLLVLGVVRPEVGVRMAYAVVGTSLIWGIGPFASSRWGWGLTAIAMTLLSGVGSRRRDDLLVREGAAGTWRAATITAAVLVLGVLGIAWFAPAVDAPETPAIADRQVEVERVAPRGGLVWPLPSEAIIWETDEFPWFENLDSLYLGGRADDGVVALHGTSRLLGRFSVNREIHGRRMIKDPGEIEALRIASVATVDALKAALPHYVDGGNEAEVEAAIRSYYLANGCEGDSFPPIIAGGANGLVIHYGDNDAPLVDGDLVVTDIGCYHRHYGSDFTRTIPVGGRFDERTRPLYTAVYEAQQAAARACGPGMHLFGKEERDGRKTLTMIARETFERHAVDPDMPHGLGHPIGLFVHDVFSWSRPLEPGMVIMIEPGLYVEDQGIGVRLEDAYIVTEDGCELLTTGFPADPDSVERRMAEVLGFEPKPSTDPADEGVAPPGEES